MRYGKIRFRSLSGTTRRRVGRLWPDPRGDQGIQKKQCDTHIGLVRGLERIVASKRALSYKARPFGVHWFMEYMLR
jgi:hypothetical protein